MSWLSITIETPANSADQLSDALIALGALSASIEDAGEGTASEQAIFGEPGEPDYRLWQTSRVKGLFPNDAEIDDIVELAGQAIDQPQLAYQVERIDEQDWVSATQAQFQPIQISDRLWISPTWHRATPDNAITIWLDPGLAFGTGTHATTRLCLHWLDQYIQGGETVLDYGCGSGILAITALKLGAAEAIGIDIDPQAMIASQHNAAQNKVAAQFYLPDEAPTLQADIVVANILANPLRILAPLLADRVKSNGWIVLSGILETQLETVQQAYQFAFDLMPAKIEEGWVCLTGRKKAID